MDDERDIRMSSNNIALEMKLIMFVAVALSCCLSWILESKQRKQVVFSLLPFFFFGFFFLNFVVFSFFLYLCSLFFIIT